MALTAQNLKDSLSRQMTDISDVDDTTFVEWCDFLNQYFYRLVYSIDTEAYISSQTYTVTSSPSTQALPATLESLKEYGCGFYYQDAASTLTDDKLVQTGIGSTNRGYYLSGTNVVFTGIDNETIILKFIPLVSTIDDLADTMLIPDRYKYYAIEALKELYYEWDEEAGLESIAGNRTLQSMEELASKLPRAPRVYSIRQSSSNY